MSQGRGHRRRSSWIPAIVVVLFILGVGGAFFVGTNWSLVRRPPPQVVQIEVTQVPNDTPVSASRPMEPTSPPSLTNAPVDTPAPALLSTPVAHSDAASAGNHADEVIQPRRPPSLLQRQCQARRMPTPGPTATPPPTETPLEKLSIWELMRLVNIGKITDEEAAGALREQEKRVKPGLGDIRRPGPLCPWAQAHRCPQRRPVQACFLHPSGTWKKRHTCWS